MNLPWKADRCWCIVLFLVWLTQLQNSSSFQVAHQQSVRLSLGGTTTSLAASSPTSKDDDVPSMDWLTDSLATSKGSDEDTLSSDMSESPFIEEFDQDAAFGEVPIPSTGVSVADEMTKAQRERFASVLVPIMKGMNPGVKAAQLVTTTMAGSVEPVRYIVGLSKQEEPKSGEDATEEDVDNMAIAANTDFVMLDVPPFSQQLATDIRRYMGKNGKLTSILVTCRDCIHYDEAPGVFSIRRADLVKWEKAFPDAAIVAYRLDIPRDCRESITQRLDGYGPFALDNETSEFVETGRPLTYEAWDHTISQDIMEGKQTPPDDELPSEDDVEADEDPYSPQAIRAREEGKRILAVCTPGRSYGSMTYIFPEVGLCASGYTIPVEDSRQDESLGLQSTGPAMDFRGYITTSKAGIRRQMESARNIIEDYVDRFDVILPSMGDPFFVDGDATQRRKELMEIVQQYEAVGQAYEDIGAADREVTNHSKIIEWYNPFLQSYT